MNPRGVPFLSLKPGEDADEVGAAIRRVVDRGWFVLGPEVEAFESEFAAACGSAFSVGVLIALFERAVGLYAALIHVNAYHQPGVQAGKLAADVVLKLQKRVVDYLAGYALAKQGRAATAAQIAQDLGQPEAAETVFKICDHLAANPSRGVQRLGGKSPHEARFEGV